MNTPTESNLQINGYKAVAALYHALMTGLILTLVSRKGADAARQFVFRLFRRQHRETFLPGLHKLGLEQLPPAVACAQYHYLSNVLGTVKVEYMYESDRKAWVRYAPPRWIWSGTAICGIPSEVSAAMMHGWHGHNGVSLIGMQLYDETAGLLGVAPGEAAAFADYMLAMARAQGEKIERVDEGGAIFLRQHGWRLMDDVTRNEVAFEAWNCVWEGALSVHNRHVRLHVTQRMDCGDPCFEWRIRSV